MRERACSNSLCPRCAGLEWNAAPPPGTNTISKKDTRDDKCRNAQNGEEGRLFRLL